MNIQKSLALNPELNDQIDLFKATFVQENNLSESNKIIVTWATAVASQSKNLLDFIKSEVGELSDSDKKVVQTASSRMAVTNPYFMSRNAHPLHAGGTLESLKMRPFQDLKIENSQGYHYACIAISSINNGFICFNSHISSLKADSQQDVAIDQAMRLVASLCAIKQLLFNEEVFQ